jgi:FkbM family methyltransferase
MSFSIYPFLRDFLKKTLQSQGVDLIRHNIHTSNEILLQQILKNFNISVVFDVGANQGLYAKDIIEKGFQGKIYSFEPIPSVFAMLQQKSTNHSNWIALNLGIGSGEDEIEMNISENLVSSSIFRVSDASIKAEPQTRITHKERVKITTIDSFVAKEKISAQKIFLKLDIQGYELEALKGALKTLPNITLIQVELSFTRLYEGAPLFSEVVSFLENQNFEIFTIIPGFRDPNTGRMLQADGIFLNKSANI